jgi:hypothetical protein
MDKSVKLSNMLRLFQRFQFKATNSMITAYSLRIEFDSGSARIIIMSL